MSESSNPTRPPSAESTSQPDSCGAESSSVFERVSACPECDYSLCTLPPVGRCPECGWEYDLDTHLFRSPPISKWAKLAMLFPFFFLGIQTLLMLRQGNLVVIWLMLVAIAFALALAAIIGYFVCKKKGYSFQTAMRTLKGVRAIAIVVRPTDLILFIPGEGVLRRYQWEDYDRVRVTGRFAAKSIAMRKKNPAGSNGTTRETEIQGVFRTSDEVDRFVELARTNIELAENASADADGGQP